MADSNSKVLSNMFQDLAVTVAVDCDIVDHTDCSTVMCKRNADKIDSKLKKASGRETLLMSDILYADPIAKYQSAQLSLVDLWIRLLFFPILCFFFGLLSLVQFR